MVRLLIFIWIVLVFIGCDPNEGKFSCSSIDGLNNLSIGSNINDPQWADIFASITPDRYQSGSFCQDTYTFSQFNEDTFDWCYYKQIDVECSTGLVDSVYNSN